MGALKIGLDSRQFFQIESADDFPAATLMGLENENRQIFKNLFARHRKYIKLFNSVYCSSGYRDKCLETPPHPSFDMMICYCST